MSESYLPKDRDRSCVSVESAAADTVEPNAVKTLQYSSFVNVEGMSFSMDRHVRGIPKALMATSLRWIPPSVELPPILQEGFPLLTCYEQETDRYVGYIALPDFGFRVTKTTSEDTKPAQVPKILMPFTRTPKI